MESYQIYSLSSETAHQNVGQADADDNVELITIKSEITAEDDGAGDDDDANHRSQQQRCLICLNSQAGVVVQCWKQFWKRGEPITVSRSKSTVFLLRRLLQFPSDQCARLLAGSGGMDPGLWVGLCGGCSSLVEGAFRLHQQVVELEGRIGKIGLKLRGTLGRSLERSERLAEVREEDVNVHAIIRDYFREYGWQSGGDDGRGPAVAIKEEPDDPPDTTTITCNNNEEDDLVNNIDVHDVTFGIGTVQYSTSEEHRSHFKETLDDDQDEGDEEERSDQQVGTGNGRRKSQNRRRNRILPPAPKPTTRSTKSTSPKSASRSHRPSCATTKRKNSLSKTMDGHGSASGPPAGSVRRTKSRIFHGKYPCTVCHCQFATRRLLSTHHANTHNNCSSSSPSSSYPFKFKCLLCSHPFSGHAGRIRHMQRKHANQPLACLTCDFVTSSPSTYYTHENGHKMREVLLPPPTSPTGDELECGFCGTKGKLQKLLRHVKLNHLPQLGIESFRCTSCELVFFTEFERSQHSTRMHNGGGPGGGTTTTTPREKRWKCDECPSDFYHKCHLQVHRRSVHQGGRELLECAVCGVNFPHRNILREHEREEHSELFRHGCEHCQKGFKTRQLLQAHKRNNHSGRRMECPQCGKSFRNAKYFKRHVAEVCKGL